MSATLDITDSTRALASADRRDCARKTCRVRAILDLPGYPSLSGKTLDLSLSGVSLLLSRALPQGHTGTVTFSVFVNGKLETIRAGVEVSNCVFLRTEVRVGFQFVELTSVSKRTLTALMR